MVKLRGIEIGTGKPKICVPITGKDIESILEQARNIAPLKAELVEWRADCAAFILDKHTVKDALEKLREILGNKILLFTFRSKEEGGEKELNVDEYLELNCFVAKTNLVDMIDIELFAMPDRIEDTVKQIHNSGCKVIMSNHDFYKTPEEKEILTRLGAMEQKGADILKIAVMPEKPLDVITLLSATCKAAERFYKPVVTMSMGKLGIISRVSGGIFGSAITFGTVKDASAPGQIPVEQLDNYLEFFNCQER